MERCHYCLDAIDRPAFGMHVGLVPYHTECRYNELSGQRPAMKLRLRRVVASFLSWIDAVGNSSPAIYFGKGAKLLVEFFTGNTFDAFMWRFVVAIMLVPYITGWWWVGDLKTWVFFLVVLAVIGLLFLPAQALKRYRLRR